MTPGGCQDEGSFSRRLAFVSMSVEVIVNAGPLENCWLWSFLLVGTKTTELLLPDSAGNSFSWFSQTGIVNIQISHLTFTCLGETQIRGSERRGAVPWVSKIKTWPSVMFKVTVIQEAHDIRQTERLRNHYYCLPMGRCNLFTQQPQRQGEYTVSNLYRIDYLCKNKNLQNKGQGWVSLHFPKDPSMRYWACGGKN